MSTVKDRVDSAIEDHCRTRAEYRSERVRVSLGELSGMPDPVTVAKVEASLTRVYALLDIAAGELAKVSAMLEFGPYVNERDYDGS